MLPGTLYLSGVPKLTSTAERSRFDGTPARANRKELDAMIDYNGEHSIFLQRHSYSGKTHVVPCTVSLLKPEDAEQSICLHNRVASGLGKDIFIPSEESAIRRCLSKDGITIGVWYQDRLVCSRTVITDKDWVNEVLSALGEQTDPSGSTAMTDYMVVDKEFRGNNVQFLTYFLSETLLSINKTRIVSTVAPKNIFSLQNILRCGFYITGLKQAYGGNIRYVMEKRLAGALPIWTNWHNTIGIRNFEEQNRVLSEGNVGYKLVRKMAGFAVLYAPMRESQPDEPQTHRHKPMISML